MSARPLLVLGGDVVEAQEVGKPRDAELLGQVLEEAVEVGEPGEVDLAAAPAPPSPSRGRRRARTRRRACCRCGRRPSTDRRALVGREVLVEPGEGALDERHAQVLAAPTRSTRPGRRAGAASPSRPAGRPRGRRTAQSASSMACSRASTLMLDDCSVARSSGVAADTQLSKLYGITSGGTRPSTRRMTKNGAADGRLVRLAPEHLGDRHVRRRPRLGHHPGLALEVVAAGTRARPTAPARGGRRADAPRRPRWRRTAPSRSTCPFDAGTSSSPISTLRARLRRQPRRQPLADGPEVPRRPLDLGDLFHRLPSTPR